MDDDHSQNTVRRPLLFAGRAEANAREVGMQLILAVDVSQSINDERYRMQKKGYISALMHPRFIASVQNLPKGALALMLFEWATFARETVLWMRIDGVESMREFCEKLSTSSRPSPRVVGINTAIGIAGRFAEGKFDTVFRTRAKTLDVSGDGENNFGEEPSVVRDSLVHRGVTIHGLPIIRPPGLHTSPDLPRYYEKNVIGGEGARVIPSQGFDDFPRAVLEKLLMEVALGGEIARVG